MNVNNNKTRKLLPTAKQSQSQMNQSQMNQIKHPDLKPVPVPEPNPVPVAPIVANVPVPEPNPVPVAPIVANVPVTNVPVTNVPVTNVPEPNPVPEPNIIDPIAPVPESNPVPEPNIINPIVPNIINPIAHIAEPITVVPNTESNLNAVPVTNVPVTNVPVTNVPVLVPEPNPAPIAPIAPNLINPIDPTSSCGITLPLDTLADSCSANAPPPPLKAYIMSILTPILEESTDALFQTLEVEPLVNRTVSNVVMTQALTPEVLERMKALDDPQVQQVLAGFKTNVEKAVQESSQILQTEVANDLGDLLGQVANKLSGAVQSLVADIPGVGVAMAALETADAAVAAVKEGEEVLNGIQSAIEPITAIQHQVAAVTDAVSAATQSAATGQLSAATGQLSAATQSVNDATQSVNDATQSVNDATQSAATGQLSAATQSAATGQLSAATEQLSAATGQVSAEYNAPHGAEIEMKEMTHVPVSAATQSAATPTNRTTRAPTRDVAESDIYQLGGGSRKRRRIHKLSRRIERTLRRVQKKYGLRNKNDFLRRTLRVRKMK